MKASKVEDVAKILYGSFCDGPDCDGMMEYDNLSPKEKAPFIRIARAVLRWLEQGIRL